MKQYSSSYFADLEKSDDGEKKRQLRTLKGIEGFKKPGKILDIGIGTGLFLRLAKVHGWELYGCDISEYAINRQKIQNEATLFTGELKGLALKDNFFDAINMRHTLEHISDDKETLNKAYKVLGPGGVISISVPNSFGIHAKVFGESWPHWSKPYHVNFYSKESLVKLVEGSGFEILKIKTEELSIFNLIQAILYRLRLVSDFKNPSSLSLLVDQALAIVGLGEGLVVIARKPKSL